MPPCAHNVESDFKPLGNPQRESASAHLGIRGNTDEVCKHVEAAKIADNLGLVDLREWPVFQWVRSDEEFEKAVLGSFGEPLTKSSTLKADGYLLIIEDDID